MFLNNFVAVFQQTMYCVASVILNISTFNDGKAWLARPMLRDFVPVCIQAVMAALFQRDVV